MLKELFEREKEFENGCRSVILKVLQNKNLDELEKKLREKAEVEFTKRPRLTKVIFAPYARGSLGKGCKVLVLYRDGEISFEHRQGAYGAIQSI